MQWLDSRCSFPLGTAENSSPCLFCFQQPEVAPYLQGILLPLPSRRALLQGATGNAVPHRVTSGEQKCPEKPAPLDPPGTAAGTVPVPAVSRFPSLVLLPSGSLAVLQAVEEASPHGHTSVPQQPGTRTLGSLLLRCCMPG